MKSPEQANAFHAAGVGQLYLAYLRDPDGNKICTLHRPPKV